jgi:rubrerythrin
MFTSSEIFDIAIRLEENGERIYRHALNYVSDPSLKETLTWLADQENQHRRRFAEMKDSMKAGSGDRWAEEMSTAILLGSVQHHAFSLEEVDFESVQDERELIMIAAEFEEDGIMFYEIIRSFVSDADIIEVLDEIIDEERKHLAFLHERQRVSEELERSQN